MQKKNEEMQDGLNKVVFYFSATLILLFSIITILFNEQANQVIINIWWCIKKYAKKKQVEF